MKLFFVGLCMLIAGTAFGQSTHAKSWPVTVQSPDKHLQLQFKMNPSGEIYYDFQADGKAMLQSSRIGPEVKGIPVFKSKQIRSVKSVWNPVWAKRSVVPDVYQELTLVFDLFTIKARLYNDGIAFRYEHANAEKEMTTFNFAGNFSAWYYNGENHNIGPEKLQDADGERLPVMTIKAGEKAFMAVHEAALESGEPLRLKAQKSLVFGVPSHRGKAWRVILYGRTPGDLVDTHLIELLNPAPAAGSDFSWVKPGVAVWDWRINGAVVDGFKYEMSLPSWKRMVDFAAENKMKALVLDADWYGPEFSKDSDPMKGGKVDQVRQIIAYGKEKGLKVWLYLNDVGGKKFPLEATLKQYGEWGAGGVKYGFMNGSPEEKNLHTQLVTRLCAENHLLVDFHDGPVHPYGQMRTWPNAVTREYDQAQSDGHKVFQPKTFATAVFVNMVAGPLDMNNGAMDMVQKGRVDNSQPVPATVTAEAARTLIVFSGATIIPDIPEYYNKYPEHLKFISAQKMPWKESKTLSGEIGEYILMARKSAEGNWLIGAAGNENARTIRIPLNVLDKGTYEALIIKDGKDADFRTNKESYTTEKRIVNKSTILEVKLAAGGGACILLQKSKVL
ncbi:alpha-glucosidase [Pedobacter steynii]|uniref:Alpha-glucosidase n=2 Tax=Pedobacter steynii TaxID=430522 RepID=A0A1G9UQP5_9SPHI|nr:glycoside hydrolase family 97 catalytic domain-containing protein [Pedobacter steynii]SDM62204.1 alpha-glucosidase [Pedobacter steynii]